MFSALAQYSGDPKTYWHLSEHQTRDSLLEAISKLPYKGGNTLTGNLADLALVFLKVRRGSKINVVFITGLALNHILQNNFKESVGMRPNSKRIGILITDGKSQDDVIVHAQNLRDQGIELYAIGEQRSGRLITHN